MLTQPIGTHVLRRPALLLAAAVLAPAVPTFGQTSIPSVRHQGLTSAWGAGYSLAVDTLYDSDDILIKAPGGAPFETDDWALIPGSGSPHYERALMFPGFTDIAIDAHTSGNGVIPRMGPNGVLAVSLVGGWFAVVASVTNSTVGHPSASGNLIRRATAAAGKPGSTLFGYYLEGSIGISNQLVGNTVVEVTHEGQRFVDGTPGPNPDIDAHDFGIGMFAHNSLPRAQWLFFHNRNEYYFSVTKAWADAQSAFFADPDLNNQPTELPDGRCIYVIRWTGSSWTVPETFVDEHEFELSEGADVDAIEIDLENRTFLFSTADQGDAPSQIMFSQRPRAGHTFPNAQVPVPLPDDVLGTGLGTAAERLGLGNAFEDGVDSLCGVDPESNSVGVTVGLPRTFDTALGDPFGLSVARRLRSYDSDTQVADELVLQVDGWGSAGVGGFDIVQYQVYLGPIAADAPMPPDSAWYHLHADIRSSQQQSVSWSLPLTTGGTLPPVSLRAVGYRLVGGVPVKAAQSWTSEIRP